MRELIAYIDAATQVFRRGEVVTKSQAGPLTVVSIEDYPAKPIDRELVDVHFFSVGFTEAAPTWSHRRFFDYLVNNPIGEFTNMVREQWEGGPSYITVGGWIGSQELALRLFALGQAHQIWTVVTPERLGFTGADADRMAGNGLVMSAGFKEPEMAT
jgi:hypothetical protein